MNEIILPEADDLDTAHFDHTSGRCIRLFLIPAEESKNGLPTVTAFDHVGAGCPEPAWHGRWAAIGSIGPQIVGESVLRTLEILIDDLLAVAERYLGSEWDGNNHVGRWRGQEAGMELDRWEDERADWQCYWDAGDYYGQACLRWEDLCEQTKVDPERALTAKWEDAVDAVAATLAADEEDDSAQVSGTPEYVYECAEQWREERLG